jgi:hypothetical protein
MAILNNNEKILEIYRLLDTYGLKGKYVKCGRGTNRVAIMIDGFCIKIAVDNAGMIDNFREFAYTQELYPYSIRGYECHTSGLMAVFEYVTVFEKEDFDKSENRMRITKILASLADRYFIGDIGLSDVNYTNLGYRYSDRSPVMLDFAYVYKTSYKLFRCSNKKCGPATMLRYNSAYTELVCPKCGKRYTFASIRERINTKSQMTEIGDITKQGYVLHSPEEDLPTILDPNVDPDVRDAYIEAKKAYDNRSDFMEAQELWKEYKRKRDHENQYD